VRFDADVVWVCSDALVWIFRPATVTHTYMTMRAFAGLTSTDSCGGGFLHALPPRDGARPLRPGTRTGITPA